jgi:hypothetical protein
MKKEWEHLWKSLEINDKKRPLIIKSNASRRVFHFKKRTNKELSYIRTVPKKILVPGNKIMV